MELPGYYDIVVYRDIHFGRPIIAGTLIKPEDVIRELAKDKTFEEVIETFHGQINSRQIQECAKYAIDSIKILKMRIVKPKINKRLKQHLEPYSYRYLDLNSDKYNPNILGTEIKVTKVLEMISKGKEIREVSEELKIPKEAVIDALVFSASRIDDFHLALSKYPDPTSVIIKSINKIKMV